MLKLTELEILALKKSFRLKAKADISAGVEEVLGRVDAGAVTSALAEFEAAQIQKVVKAASEAEALSSKKLDEEEQAKIDEELRLLQEAEAAEIEAARVEATRLALGKVTLGE